MSSPAEIEGGSRPVSLEVQYFKAYRANPSDAVTLAYGKVIDSPVKRHVMFTAEPLIVGDIMDPFWLFYASGNVAKHDLIIAQMEENMKAFSERYKCPMCGGTVADGKYLGYEDQAYCLGCRCWIDLEDLQLREEIAETVE